MVCFLVACQSAWYENVIKTFLCFFFPLPFRSSSSSWSVSLHHHLWCLAEEEVGIRFWFSGRVLAIFYDSTLHKYDLLVLVIFVTSILRISFRFIFFAFVCVWFWWISASNSWFAISCDSFFVAVIWWMLPPFIWVWVPILSSASCNNRETKTTTHTHVFIYTAVEMQTRKFIPLRLFVCCHCVSERHTHTRNTRSELKLCGVGDDECDCDCDRRQATMANGNEDDKTMMFFWLTQFRTIYFHTTNRHHIAEPLLVSTEHDIIQCTISPNRKLL